MGRTAQVVPGAARARRIRPAVANCLLIGFLTALTWVFWPSSLGGCSTFTIVAGHSMEPTYYTGDLVWARCGNPGVGDVVIYQPLRDTDAQVIHRIIGGSAAQGWQIQGDNNEFVDPWQPKADQIMGRAIMHLPNVGRIMYLLSSPLAWLSLFIVAGGLLLWPSKQNLVPGAELELVAVQEQK